MAAEEIIIDIKIPADEVLQKLAETQHAIAMLRDENKKLAKERDTDTSTWKQNSAAIAANNAQIKNLTGVEKTMSGQINKMTNENRVYGESIYEMQAKLQDLRDQYRSLNSEQERNSEGGKSLQKSIQQLDEKVNEANFSIGSYQANIGNYRLALMRLNPVLGQTINFFGGITTSIKGAGTMMRATFTSMTSIIRNFARMIFTTPIGWLALGLAGIVAILSRLGAAFKRSDDSGTAWSRGLATFQPIITGIGKAFDLLANGIGKAVDAIGNFIARFSDSAKDARQLVTDLDNLEEKEREYTVSSAKNNAEISKLRNESRQTEKYTVEQRKKMLEDALKLEQENLDAEIAIAEEKFRLLQLEAKKNNDTSDEMKKKIAEATAEMYNAQDRYYTGTTRLATQFNAAIKEINAEQDEELKKQEDARKEALERQKKRVEEAIKIAQTLEDELIKINNEGINLQIKQEEINTERKIQEIRKRLKEETDLTKQARLDLNQLIEIYEISLQKRIQDIKNKSIEDEYKARIQAEKNRIEILIQRATEGSDAERALRLRAIEILQEEELKSYNETLTKRLSLVKGNADAEKSIMLLSVTEIDSIMKKYDLQRQDVYDQIIVKQQKEIQQAFQNEIDRKIISAKEDYEKIAQIELEAAIEKNKYLLMLDLEQKNALYENQAEYEAAVIDSNKRIVEAQKNVLDKQFETVEKILEAFSSFANMGVAMSELFGKQGEEMSAFAKAMAIFQISVNTAVALTESIKGAITAANATGPLQPFFLAGYIAAAIGTVLSAVAQAKQLLQVEPPKFAQGGIVPGIRYYGDKVPVMANSGEMFINTEQQRNLLSAIRTGNLGTSFNYDALTTMFIEAVREIPPNELSLVEWTNFNKQIILRNETSKL